jgi:polynucleotide 5'-kinase involved in rRNA processing
MSNTGKLREYLIGESGYLFNEISKGKVIMLSGEWGSGKTHFWNISDDSIKAKLDQKAKLNIYISLYGKSSLQEIENEVFTKAYYKSKGRDDNRKDAIEKLSSTFSKLSSYVDEVSPIKITPLIDYLGELKEDSQKNRAEELMKEGLIIAFDDFERKSTLVNLNDLFGFITNLTIPVQNYDSYHFE